MAGGSSAHHSRGDAWDSESRREDVIVAARPRADSVALAQPSRTAPNLFHQLDPAARDAIFHAKSRRGTQHGQARVNELFRQVRGRIIRRAEMATVAQQDDFMKRARGNGGARSTLRPEGILVLGHQENDPFVARDLGLPVPGKGELVAARVVPAFPNRSDPVAVIDGQPWAQARPDDPAYLAPQVGRARA